MCIPKSGAMSPCNIAAIVARPTWPIYTCEAMSVATGKTDCNTLNVASLLALMHDTAPATLHRQGHCTPKSHPQAAYVDSDRTAMANCKSRGRAHTKFSKASAGPCQESSSSLKAEWATEDRMSLGKGSHLLVPWVRTLQGMSKHNC